MDNMDNKRGENTLPACFDGLECLRRAFENGEYYEFNSNYDTGSNDSTNSNDEGDTIHTHGGKRGRESDTPQNDYEEQEHGHTSKRNGKWTQEEEAYARQLILDFREGNFSKLECPTGSSLRAFLATKLDCVPMRVSKKFARTNIGRLLYCPREDVMEKPQNPLFLKCLERDFQQASIKSYNKAKAGNRNIQIRPESPRSQRIAGAL
jgi:hypothetical protein